MAVQGPHGSAGVGGLPPAMPETVALNAGGPETLAWAAGATVAGDSLGGLAGYDLLEELGRGGMGVVYKAADTELNRVVAIKVLPGRGAVDPLELARFRIEAETMAAVSHPNVVAVYNIREAAGQPYIVMEYVNGGSLSALLRRDGALGAAEAARVVFAVARGVGAAHEQGVIHRDLKPANVLLHLPPRREPGTEGSGPPSAAGPPPSQPKVADFGLARRGLSNDVTTTGAVLGTPAYMAPEQASGLNKLVGPAVDVYALGVILYECLAGRPPFVGDDHWAILRQVVDADPKPLRELRPDAPRDLELICGKCLAKDPRDRYASADAVADDLACHLEGRPLSVRPVSALEASRKWARRNPALARMAAVLALAALALAASGVKYAQDARAAAQRDRDSAQDLALSEEKGKALAAERQAAVRAAEDAQRLARSQQFYRRLTAAEACRFEPTPGWTLDALADVAELAGSPEAAGERGKLRDLAAAALASPDLEECAAWWLPESGPFTYPSLVATHPSAPLVAVARFGYSVPEFRLTVWLIDWRTGTTRTLTAPVWLSQLSTKGKKESPDRLVFQPDGRRLHLSTRRGNAFSWDLDDPAAPAREEPKFAGFGPLAFRPDGRGFWKADENELRACDAAGRVLASRKLRGKVATLGYAAASGSLVVAVGDAVQVLDPEDLSDLARQLKTHSHFTTATVAPDGRGGVAAVDNEVSWLDATDNRLAGTLDRGQDSPGDEARHPVFSPDGSLVAVPREHSHSLLLLSTRTGQPLATVPTPNRTHAPPVAFSADGGLLFVGAQDRLRAFRVRPGALTPAAVGLAPLLAVALDPSGRALAGHAATPFRLGAGTAATAGQLAAWDLARPGAPGLPLHAQTQYNGTMTGHAPSFQPDGPWLAYGLSSARGLWNPETDECRPPATPAGAPGVFAPSGRLWRGGRDGRSATASEVPGGRQLVAFEDAVERHVSGEAPTAVLFTAPDGLLVGTATGLLNWLDPEGRRLGRWKAGPTEPSVAARRPGGPEVFVGHDSGDAGVFRLPSGESVASWKPHLGRVTAAVWLGPDDLLTAGADRRIHLWRWDGAAATRVWSLRTAAGIRQMLLAPGGRVVVLEDGARGVGLLDAPRFHAELAALVPTEALRLTPAVAAESPLPAVLKPGPAAPAAGLRADYFTRHPGSDERVYLASGHVPGLPNPAAAPPHRDLPATGFAARYRGFVQAATPGVYTLTISASDKVTVTLDGAALTGEGTVALTLTGQPQRLRIEWEHADGPARLSLAWATGATPPTLTPDRP